jgi:CubicO group peptidase (beta-lactamase class C family)
VLPARGLRGARPGTAVAADVSGRALMRRRTAMRRHEVIRNLLDTMASDRRTGEVLWRMRSDDGQLDITYGNAHRPFFVASCTKLFVVAILAQLRAEQRLDWDAPLATYLPDLNLTGLVVVRGVDHSHTMTVRQVMAHTAGLADYFEGRRRDGSTTFARVVGQDLAWNLQDVLAWTREMPSGRPGRGVYSDTGYQLLGAVIERLERRPFSAVVQARIVAPLGLSATWCFMPVDVARYDAIATLFYGATPLSIPRAMASVQADGGMVTTLDDGLRFLAAFFGGALCDAAILAEVQSRWHAIFAPFEVGCGVMRLRLPMVLTGLRRVPPFVGHGGASGAVMFRAPEWGLTVVGTVNQLQHRSLAYRLMIQSALAARG